jgi:hypothetical protein
MSRVLAVSLVSVTCIASQGCLVLSLQPAYTDEAIAWDEGLLGRWRDAEDDVEVTIERGEWRSYRVHYKHPIEEADYTAWLTVIGDTHFLDLMPARGLDYGAVLIPSHLVLRISRDGDRWLVSSIDYDRLRASIKAGRAATLAGAAFDQRQNIVLTASSAALRDWLRARTDEDFDAPTSFERIAP